MPQTYINKSATAKRAMRKRQAKKNTKTADGVARIAQRQIDKNLEFKRKLRDLPATAITNITNGQILWQGPRIPAGTGEMDRIGLRVNLRKLRFKYIFKSIGGSNRVRLILIKYPQPAGSAQNLEDCLVNVTAQNVMCSPWLKNGAVKYQVVYNRIHKLGVLGVMDGSYKYQEVKFDISFKKEGESLHYVDATTSNPDKNSYVLYCVADQALASPNQNEVLGYSECVFTDN